MTHFVIRLKKDKDPTVFIRRAAEIVKEGGLIAYPTNTVYGMGADPLNLDAVNQIFYIKNRDYKQGLPVLVADQEEAKKVGIFTQYEMKLVEKFWPGELTIIVPLKNPKIVDENSEMEKNGTPKFFLDKLITGGSDNIALRVPQNNIILGICKELKKTSEFGGIIGTSANISGENPCIMGKQVVSTFGSSLNFIIDTGKCKDKIPSTIVKIDHNLLENKESFINSLKIIREGKISREEILEALK